MSDVVNGTVEMRPVPIEAAVFRKVSLRILPFLFLLYVVNLIDRTNVSMTRLQMVDEQRILDEASYSLGAGIFYVGYLLFEVPSNLILLRMGARKWIARILVSWGLISAAMMFVTGPWSFGILRVLLGVAEAGFFPGIIYYLSDWFPARVRARAVAQFMLGGVIASMIGNPLSGLILSYMDQIGGLWGWQWVFVLEGVPAVALGFVTLGYLTDSPDQASWLTPAERTWLAQQIENERTFRPLSRSHSLAAAVVDLRVWMLIAIYFTVAMGDNSYGFYVPTFLKSQFPHWSADQIGLLAAAPSVTAMIGMVLVGRNSDRTGERRWHVAGSAFTAALGWLMLALVVSVRLTIPGLGSRWLFVGALAVTLMGMKCMLPVFWTLPPSFLSGAAAAGGIALINSVANIGGLLGPRIMGQVKVDTGNFTIGYLIMAATLLLGGLLVLCVGRRIHHKTDI
ncbi:MAG TPA: MFS transporter [Gemmataceae bacterium]|jgi:ACS family tartrate transporter-like MFS transporter